MNFENLDLTGIRPTSVPLETIEVSIDPAVMVDDYAKAFRLELLRNEPRRFEQVNLTEEEIIKYCRYILRQRIACVTDTCKDWRIIKNLWIPIFIQYSISLVGLVIIPERGLKLMPVMDKTDEVEELSLSEALEISGRIGLFSKTVQMRLDAMPRSKYGDQDTMSCALIAGYVRTLAPSGVEHPVATYIAAFMGFSIKREREFAVLYRVQYDDLEFIRAALTNNRTVMGSGD